MVEWIIEESNRFSENQCILHSEHVYSARTSLSNCDGNWFKINWLTNDYEGVLELHSDPNQKESQWENGVLYSYPNKK